MKCSRPSLYWRLLHEVLSMSVSMGKALHAEWLGATAIVSDGRVHRHVYRQGNRGKNGQVSVVRCGKMQTAQA